MIDPRTLRGQLGLAYAATLLLALVAFAAITLVVVDRTQRAALDDRLMTSLRAVGALVDVQHGRIVLDMRDFTQFAHVVGTRLDAAILDAGGAPLATTAEDLPAGIAAAARSVTGDGPRLLSVASAEGHLRAALEPVPPGRNPHGVVVVWREFDDITELDRRLTILFGFAIPLIAAFALLAGSAVAARGLRPLDTISAVASEIEAHDLSRRLAIPPRDDELGRLCATFDRMLDRLEDAFARQRRFTGDASHELRAPLSVIRAEADLALRRARTPEEYERALRSIAAQADYLEDVARDLLAAARAEATASGDAVADLAAVAAGAAARLDPIAHARGVALTVRTPGPAAVRGDAAALERAVVCVVHNAIKYARSGVAIELEIAADAQRLLVTDDGPGFSADALAHATERFWRDDPARSQRGTADDEGGGAGLGLAIAAAIVTASGGTLTLENIPPGGGRVVVAIAAAPQGRS